jgi:hypothetical protein
MLSVLLPFLLLSIFLSLFAPPPPLFRPCCPGFLAHVVSSLAYPNLLGTKRLGCWLIVLLLKYVKINIFIWFMCLAFELFRSNFRLKRNLTFKSMFLSFRSFTLSDLPCLPWRHFWAFGFFRSVTDPLLSFHHFPLLFSFSFLSFLC